MKLLRFATFFLASSIAATSLAQPPPPDAGPFPPPIVPRVDPLSMPAGPVSEDGKWSLYQAPDGFVYDIPVEIPYDPAQGIPPGYRRSVKSRRGLMAAGLSVAGGLWFISIIAAITHNTNDPAKSDEPLALPVIGPLITVGTTKSSPAGTTLLVLDSFFQTAGVVTFLLARQYPELTVKNRSASLTMMPVAAPAQNGGMLGLAGSF